MASGPALENRFIDLRPALVSNGGRGCKPPAGNVWLTVGLQKEVIAINKRL